MAKTAVVTGSMGAGKSLILSAFRAKGLPVFEADRAAQSLLGAESPCHQALRELLGERLLKPDGSFDRKLLARELFQPAPAGGNPSQNETKRKAVESIIHPLVRRRFLRFLKKERARGAELVFYEIPLILTAEGFSPFDFLILITAPEALRLQRLIKKGWTEESIRFRWGLQTPEAEILGRADFVIPNKGSRRELRRRAEEVLGKIKNFIKSSRGGRRRAAKPPPADL